MNNESARIAACEIGHAAASGMLYIAGIKVQLSPEANAIVCDRSSTWAALSRVAELEVIDTPEFAAAVNAAILTPEPCDILAALRSFAALRPGVLLATPNHDHYTPQQLIAGIAAVPENERNETSDGGEWCADAGGCWKIVDRGLRSRDVYYKAVEV